MSGSRVAVSVALVALAAGCATRAEEAALPYGSASADCGGCHETHEAEWARSPHARASRSPLLAAMLPEVERAWGVAARDRCVACHAPAFGGEGDDGIGCVACHAAVGNHAERDGMLAVKLDAPLAGPRGGSTSDAHRTRQSGFLRSEALCGTCHELTGPGLVREPTLTEFRASPQAAAGATCIDCHAPRATDGASRAHTFVGFDPPYGATPDEAARAAADTRALLARALTLEASRTAGGVRVTVTNTGAAHSVPTGAAFLRDLWVDLEDASGRTLAARVLTLGDQPTHAGSPVPLLTRADAVTGGSLAPTESTTYVAPGFSETVQVVLRGRAVRLAVLDALGARGLEAELPVHEIVRLTLAP